MEDLAAPGGITAGMTSYVGVDWSYGRDMTQSSLSYITHACEQELTPPIAQLLHHSIHCCLSSNKLMAATNISIIS